MKLLVVDDAPLARAHLIRCLAGRPGIDVVGEAADGKSALEACAALSPDALFLDIDMPILDGFSVAESLRNARIVFVTAHAKFAVGAFDIDAVDFVLKPFTRDRIDRALERLAARNLDRNERADTLMIAERGGARFIPVRGITRFYALDKYTAFRFGGRELLVRDSLDDLASRYGMLGFHRIHRSELVQISAVTELTKDDEGSVAVLSDGQRARVSRREAPGLRDLLSA